jgi:site-specific DNA recombinase
MESAWSNGKPACRCRHGQTSAARPDPARPKNAYVREEIVVAQLPALHSLLTSAHESSANPAARRRRRTRRGTDAQSAASVSDVIICLREHRVTLTLDQDSATLRTGAPQSHRHPGKPTRGHAERARRTKRRH